MRGRPALDVEPPPYLSAVPVLAVGVVAAVLIVAGVAYPVAATMSAAAWLACVAGLRVLTRADPRRPAPWRVSSVWRPYVRRALTASVQYRSMLAALNPGPLQERLADAARQVDRVVVEVWRQALIADQLDSRAVGTDTTADPGFGAEIQDASAVQETMDRLDKQLSDLIGKVGLFVSTHDHGDGEAVVQLSTEIDALRDALAELEPLARETLPDDD